MTKMDFARKFLDKRPGKLSTVPCSHSGASAATMKETFKRLLFVALFCLGLLPSVARAQFLGVTKPFDPTSPQMAPIGEAIATGNGIEYNGGPVMLGPH